MRVASAFALVIGVCSALVADESSAVVVSDEVRLTDADRGKELPVLAVHPEAGGPYPLIVFSHGAGGSGRMVVELPKRWAARGYVVLLPTHADSIALRRRDGDGRAGLRDALRTAVGSPQAWTDRPKDVSFLLDSLDELEEAIPGLAGKIDRERIGVGGHSFGAYTAQLIGGATVTLPGEPAPVSFADEWVDAVVLLSAQGPGQQGLTEGSWRDFRRPMLNVTGDRDRGAQGQGPDWKRKPFELAPPGDKYHLDLAGAHHGSFTGRFADATAAQGRVFEATAATTLAFWDTYLKEDEAAKRSLAEKRVEQDAPGVATLTAK